MYTKELPTRKCHSLQMAQNELNSCRRLFCHEHKDCIMVLWQQAGLAGPLVSPLQPMQRSIIAACCNKLAAPVRKAEIRLSVRALMIAAPDSTSPVQAGSFAVLTSAVSAQSSRVCMSQLHESSFRPHLRLQGSPQGFDVLYTCTRLAGGSFHLHECGCWPADQGGHPTTFKRQMFRCRLALRKQSTSCAQSAAAVSALDQTSQLPQINPVTRSMSSLRCSVPVKQWSAPSTTCSECVVTVLAKSWAACTGIVVSLLPWMVKTCTEAGMARAAASTSRARRSAMSCICTDLLSA